MIYPLTTIHRSVIVIDMKKTLYYLLRFEDGSLYISVVRNKDEYTYEILEEIKKNTLGLNIITSDFVYVDEEDIIETSYSRKKLRERAMLEVL